MMHVGGSFMSHCTLIWHHAATAASLIPGAMWPTHRTLKLSMVGIENSLFEAAVSLSCNFCCAFVPSAYFIGSVKPTPS